mmetsp:Transcript_8558/g.8678  ORF Transcript_8558/g.8678 Transcript_8558/m.8678 type:complete len:444 (+) Transcript_8558:295-1626(+)
MKRDRIVGLDLAFLHADRIVFLTFYRGIPPIEFLRGKVDDILMSNPWLNGHITSSENELYLNYDKSGRNTSLCFTVIDVKHLHEGLSYDRIRKIVTDENILKIKKGQESINNNNILFQVTVLKISNDKFAILFGFNHVLGDANTLYQLYGMLSSSSQVFSMKLNKPSIELSKQMFERFGMNDSVSVIKSFPATCQSLLFSIYYMIFPAVKQTIHYINEEYIESQKKKHLTSPSNERTADFISTNDIITSWYFKACRVLYGIYMVNARGRMTELNADNTYAGNYGMLITLTPPDYATPALVRQSLKCFRRYVTGDKPLPSAYNLLLGHRMAGVSNWSAIYQDVQLPGCVQLLHLPITEEAQASSIARVFRPLRHKLAMVISTPYLSSQDKETAPILCAPEGVLDEQTRDTHIDNDSLLSSVVITCYACTGVSLLQSVLKQCSKR